MPVGEFKVQHSLGYLPIAYRDAVEVEQIVMVVTLNSTVRVLSGVVVNFFRSRTDTEVGGNGQFLGFGKCGGA